MPEVARSPLFEVLARIPQREGELPALVPTLELDALMVQCARHGVSAYVGDAFARAQVTLPAAAQSALSLDARGTVARGAKNKRLLLAVLDALAAQNVTPIVLKGLGLATRLYDSPLSRPSTDVDVLIVPTQMPVVHQVLIAMGLVAQADPALGDVLEEHHHHAFAGPAGLVEVHFRLFAGFGMASYDDAAVQARAWSANLERRAVRYLSAEDEFLYLAVHAANHAFLRASWLVDLQRFAIQTPPRWERVAELAREVGFTVPYAAALDALSTALQAPVPEVATEAAGHRGVRHVVHRWLFSARHLGSARLAEGALAPFLIRLWLVDSPARGVTQFLGGLRRLVRRAASRS